MAATSANAVASALNAEAIARDIAGLGIADSGAITATDGTLNSSSDDTKVVIDSSSKGDRPASQLPPWLDIIVYWQHTKADQPISANWGLKSSMFLLSF